MPTRYLKPGIRDSGHIEGLSAHPDAEVLYYRLLVTVDDFGRFDGRPDMVKAYCFPTRLRATADKCMQWLKSLESVGLVILYEFDNKPYLQITKWDNKPRATSSKFPSPPSDVYSCPQMLPVTVTVTETETVNLNREPEPITETKSKTSTAQKKTNGKALELPEWIPTDQWNAWIEARIKKRNPPTQFALKLAIIKLDAMREQGHSVARILADSAFNGWAGLFPPKD